MPRGKSKGGLGVARTYRPTRALATVGEEGGEAAEVGETLDVERGPILEPADVAGEGAEPELQAEETGKATRRKGKEPTEAEEERQTVTDALQRIAVSAFDVDRLDRLPEYVVELSERLSLDDADVFWEFASLVRDGQGLTDYYVAIRRALEERSSVETLRTGRGIPHYHSLVYDSPLLIGERQADDERDAQLLRKDKPVRGAVSCGKCGDNLVSTRQVQLRGLDEPSTNIYTCYTCSNMWSV
jgi:DNA-directed RNA polymerase subunit M/transcription elongation factor TFIIS